MSRLTVKELHEALEDILDIKYIVSNAEVEGDPPKMAHSLHNNFPVFISIKAHRPIPFGQHITLSDFELKQGDGNFYILEGIIE
jgi:hypothetical protein